MLKGRGLELNVDNGPPSLYSWKPENKLLSYSGRVGELDLRVEAGKGRDGGARWPPRPLRGRHREIILSTPDSVRPTGCRSLITPRRSAAEVGGEKPGSAASCLADAVQGPTARPRCRLGSEGNCTIHPTQNFSRSSLFAAKAEEPVGALSRSSRSTNREEVGWRSGAPLWLSLSYALSAAR